MLEQQHKGHKIMTTGNRASGCGGRSVRRDPFHGEGESHISRGRGEIQFTGEGERVTFHGTISRQRGRVTFHGGGRTIHFTAEGESHIYRGRGRDTFHGRGESHISRGRGEIHLTGRGAIHFPGEGRDPFHGRRRESHFTGEGGDIHFMAEGVPGDRPAGCRSPAVGQRRHINGIGGSTIT